MALSANTVFEVQIGGSDTNGGGFVTGASGTDHTQTTTPYISVTDGVTAGTTTITSASAAFDATIVGNLVYVQGGTGPVAAGWYQITTWSASTPTQITVDRSTGLTAGTGVTLKIGGALASPAVAASIATVAGMMTYIKYSVTAYQITTASYNVAGGCCQPTSGTYIVGYDTTRALYTPFQNRPTLQLQAAVSGATIYQGLNNAYSLQGVILDANSQTTSSCFNSSGEAFYVKVMNFTTAGILQNTATLTCILCEATGGSGAVNVLKAQVAYFCASYSNTQSVNNLGGFAVASAAVSCIAYGNSQCGFTGSGDVYYYNCVAYGNSAAGFYINTVNPTLAVNCIAEANTTYGYYINTGQAQLINCASYNNTSGRKGGAGTWQADVGAITGSGSFFTNAASQDFRLNSAAGGGALLRNIGFPTNLLGIGSNYLDIGALQAQCLGVSGMIASFEVANAQTWRKIDTEAY